MRWTAKRNTARTTPVYIEPTTIKTSIVIGMAALCLAACGTQVTNHSAASSGHAQCQVQFKNWLRGNGGANVEALRVAFHRYHDATAALATSVSAANLSRLLSAAVTLQSVAQASQLDPPPECMRGFRTAYSSALADFDRVAQNAGVGAQAAQNGNWQTANGDIQASTTALMAARQAMIRARLYMTVFGPSG
jgi:hypothetical protein